jgi:serine/threonine protein kinase
MIHRDIKADNILVDNAFNVKVCCRANMKQIRQSTPDAGLDLSHLTSRFSALCD